MRIGRLGRASRERRSDAWPPPTSWSVTANDGSDQAEVGVWSPDAKYLLVQRGAARASDLWIMDLEGTFIGQVTHEPSSYGTYGWAAASSS